jgi:hypothetical protein
VVGANWGLYSVDRKEVFPLTGQVYENPDWLNGVMASTVLFLIFVVCCWKPLQTLSLTRLAVFLLFSQLLAMLLANMVENLWYTSYSDWQRFQTALTVGLNAVLGVLILLRGLDLLANRATHPKFGAWIYTLYMVFAAYAVYKTFGLSLNGRYTSFPTEAVYITVAGIFGLMVIRTMIERSWLLKNFAINRLVGHQNIKADQNKIIGYALLAVGLLLILWETKAFVISRDFILAYPNLAERTSLAFVFSVTNCQLAVWLVCLVILALPLLVGNNYDGQTKAA